MKIRQIRNHSIALLILPILGLGACSPSAPSADAASNIQLAADNLKAAEDFLAQNKTKTGVITTQSGLQYSIIKQGSKDGKKPVLGSIVQVNYEGKLLNDSVFDSTYNNGQAAEFRVGGLVPSWNEALQLMHPGDEWTIWSHPNLGYGETGACDPGQPQCAIPPNALLIFKMRLEKTIGADGVVDISPSDAVDGVKEH